MRSEQSQFSVSIPPFRAFGWLGERAANMICPSRFEEILASLDQEARDKSGVTWRELLEPINRKRVFLIIALQIGSSPTFRVHVWCANQFIQASNLPETRLWLTVCT